MSCALSGMTERWVFAELPRGSLVRYGMVPEASTLRLIHRGAWRSMSVEMVGLSSFLFPLRQSTMWRLHRHARRDVEGFGEVYLYFAVLQRDECGEMPTLASGVWVVLRTLHGGGVVVMGCQAVVMLEQALRLTLTTLAGGHYLCTCAIPDGGITLKYLKELAAVAAGLPDDQDVEVLVDGLDEEVPVDFVLCELRDVRVLHPGCAFDWGMALEGRAPKWRCASCEMVKRIYHFDAPEWERIRRSESGSCLSCTMTATWFSDMFPSRALVLGSEWWRCVRCGVLKVEAAFPSCFFRDRMVSKVGEPYCLECFEGTVRAGSYELEFEK